MPLVVTIYMIINWRESIQNLFLNEEIPLLLLLWGTVGQLIFTFRFVYQWIYSLRRKISVLPEGFWIISLIGSSIIFVYAIFRRDPVLMLGQGLGFFIYTRNLILLKNRI